MAEDVELLKKYRKVTQKFWRNIENDLLMPIPRRLKKLLEYSHLDNATLLKGISYEQLLSLEDLLNSEEYRLEAQSHPNTAEYYGRPYRAGEKYLFTLGEKEIFRQMLNLVKTKPKDYWELETQDECLCNILKEIDKWFCTFEHVNEHKNQKWPKSTLLHMFIKTLSRNSQAKSKEGYRYDESLKLLAGYIYVLGGRILYENLSANIPLPSRSTAMRAIHKTVKPVIEGECRVKELSNFLKNKKYTNRVWLSEDATRIVPKVEYDSNNNSLVGLVQPLDKNTGFPINDFFKANSVAAIQSHFKNHPMAQYLYCYMVQPLQMDAPSFCLCMFGTDSSFTGEDTVKRWDYLFDLLAENDIHVLGCSGDGDPRVVKAMRIKSELGLDKKDTRFLIDGFHANYMPPIISMQDATHLAIKFKTRCFKISITLPIGDYIVSSSHLLFLLENFTREKHFLTRRHLDGKDKMNFEAVYRISSGRVIDLLKNEVPGSGATQEYLKIINFIVYSFLSTNLSISLRLYCIWYSIFFVRLWRTWLSVKSDQYSITNNFLSTNTYVCLEINAHGFTSMVLKTIEDKSLRKFLLPWMFGSQSCEGHFRTLRSLSSVFCTVVNCSILEAMRKTQRMEFLSEVMTHNFKDDKINFPRNTFINASFEKFDDNNVYLDADFQKLDIFKKELNLDVIKSILDLAKKDALQNIKNLGVKNVGITDANNLAVNPLLIKDECLFDEQDAEIQADGIVEIDENNLGFEDYLEENERSMVGEMYQNLDLRDYSKEHKNITGNDPYVQIEQADGTTKTVRKSSICYILNQNSEKLSSDRLIRVQSFTKARKNEIRVIPSQVSKLDYVHVLDWCLFMNEDLNKCLVGFVLGFAYMDESKWKNIEFSKSYAKVFADKKKESSDEKRVGVLCQWYILSAKNKMALTPAKLESQGYHAIENYRYTIPIPQKITLKNKDCLMLNEVVYDTIKNIVQSY